MLYNDVHSIQVKTELNSIAYIFPSFNLLNLRFLIWLLEVSRVAIQEQFLCCNFVSFIFHEAFTFITIEAETIRPLLTIFKVGNQGLLDFQLPLLWWSRLESYWNLKKCSIMMFRHCGLCCNLHIYSMHPDHIVKNRFTKLFSRFPNLQILFTKIIKLHLNDSSRLLSVPFSI